MAYRLIVGLGNPGARYADTRHNAGFWFVDALARAAGCSLAPEKRFDGEIGRVTAHGADCRLLKPATFMNVSGRSVAAVASYYRIDMAEILVAHDELDLAPGVARLKRGGGHGGHNGLRDIVARLGGREFDRLRLGIGRPPQAGADVSPWVLGRATADERTRIEAAIERVLAELPALLQGDLQALMNRLHGEAT